MKPSKFILGALAAAALVCSSAHAAGAIDQATETTQLMNNIELASQYAKQIEQYKTQINEYTTQLQQYERQLKDALNVNAYVPGIGATALGAEYKNVAAARQAFEALFGTLDDLGRDWQARMMRARAMDLEPDEYWKWEQVRIAQGSQDALRRLADEQRMLDDVQSDYALAKEWNERIAGQEGINASLGLLNTQMNRMLQQNARVVQILAQANGSDKAAEQQKEAERAELSQQLLQQQQERDRAAYNAARPTPRPAKKQ